jgi:hypothetical protein
VRAAFLATAENSAGSLVRTAFSCRAAKLACFLGSHAANRGAMIGGMITAPPPSLFIVPAA